MKKQLLEVLNLRLAAMENEITTLQNQITNLSQPTCTNDDLTQMKLLVSKFPLSNLKNAQYLHATQLQVANLFEQLEHEKNLRRQQDRVIQQLQIVVEDLQKKTKTSTVEQPVNTPLPTPPPTEPESTDTQRRLAELKHLKRLTMDLFDRIHSIDYGRDKKLIWRNSSFSLMFDNAKTAELERQKVSTLTPKYLVIFTVLRSTRQLTGTASIWNSILMDALLLLAKALHYLLTSFLASSTQLSLGLSN